MKPWRIGCWSCTPSTISRGIKQFLTFLYLETWNRQNSCQTCLLCFQLVTNHVSFYKEPFSRDYPPMFALTCLGMISPILSLSPWERTKYIRAGYLQPLCSQFPTPQRISSPSIQLDHQLLTAPAVLLLLMPATTRITFPSLLPCVIIIVHGVPRPRDAELRVPGRETSSPAGGCSYPSCRTSYFVSFNLFTRFTEFMEIPHRFWCFCISVSCSTFFFYFIRSQVTYSRWFLSHVLWFLDYSSTVWDPQVAFTAGSGNNPNPGCRISEVFQPVALHIKPESFQHRFTNLPIHCPANLSRLRFSSTQSQPSHHSEVHLRPPHRVSWCCIFWRFYSL